MTHRKEHPQRDATNVQEIFQEMLVNLLGLRSWFRHRIVAGRKKVALIFIVAGNKNSVTNH
jgi:hypothetical protein